MRCPPAGPAALLLLATACGGSTALSPADAGPARDAASTDTGSPVEASTDGSPAPDASPDASDVCHLDAPGATFTFHVHNGGTRMLSLAYGCSASLPITLNTLQGVLGIGPGPANTCEFTCDYAYSPMAATACSDCGPGVGAALGPGVTADIAWDRRVYEEITADPSCTHGNGAQGCAFGHAAPPATMQAGTLTVCTSPSAVSSSCATSQTFQFMADTTQSSATIEVQ